MRANIPIPKDRYQGYAMHMPVAMTGRIVSTDECAVCGQRGDLDTTQCHGKKENL